MVKVDKDLLLIIIKYVKKTYSLISELGKKKIAHDNMASMGLTNYLTNYFYLAFTLVKKR